MNRQEIFNKAYLGLQKQGFKRCMTPNSFADDACQYRNEKGMACAVGHCIADEDYDESMEGLPADEPEVYNRMKLDEPPIYDEDFAFLLELQACHDDSPEPDRMKKTLVSFAGQYDLNVPGDE